MITTDTSFVSHPHLCPRDEEVTRAVQAMMRKRANFIVAEVDRC
jgi:hypothetical protein